jgi:hypothetical protein
MNAMRAASGAPTGASPTSFLRPATGSQSASLLAGGPARTGTAAASGRDDAAASLLDLPPTLNLLRTAAGVQSSDPSEAPLLNLPPLAPMPAPKPAPSVPTDDHGQSNIVFSDPDGGSAPIR